MLSLLEEQRQRLSEVLPQSSASTSDSFRSLRFSPRDQAVSPTSLVEENDASLETQFLVPSGHSATLCWLLSLPPIRSILGDLPQSYFYGLAENTALPQPLDLFQPIPCDWPPLESDRLQDLADRYFEKISCRFPLLTRQYYETLQDSLLHHGPQQDLETAICLSIYALGCITSRPEKSTDSQEDLGLQYFAKSLRIVMTRMITGFPPSLPLCQSLVLAAMYFECLGRPIHAWKMIFHAGQQFVQIINL